MIRMLKEIHIFFFSMKVNLFLKSLIYRAEEECVALLSSAKRKRKEKNMKIMRNLSTRKWKIRVKWTKQFSNFFRPVSA